MDLSIGLVTLLGMIGYNLSTVRQRKYPRRNRISEHEIPVGTNVYTSDDYQKNLDKEMDKMNNHIHNPNTIVTKPTEMDKIHRGPMFSESNGLLKEQVLEKFEILIDENTGPSTSKLSGITTDFKHNNMQPFFGSTVKSIVDSGVVLEKYQGLNKPGKKELENSFINGQQDTVGMKNYTELVDPSRFVPGRMINNVVPFAQEKEIPLDRTHFEISEKNVDELRNLNNQKISGVAAPINYGAKEYKRPLDPVFTKNGVATVFKQSVSDLYPTGDRSNKGIRTTGEATTVTTAKHSLAEVQFNLPAGNYGRGEVNRNSDYSLTKDDKLPGNWGNLATGIERVNRPKYYIPQQERETGNILRFGGAGKREGEITKTGYKAKVTNKELSTYEYIPNAVSGVSKPGTAGLTKINAVGKKSIEYFPGGVDKLSVNLSKTIVSNKKRLEVSDYIGGTRSLITKQNENRPMDRKRIAGVERDFGYRLM